MKVLHVINSLAAGGAEKLVSELCSRQSDFYEVGLFTFVSDNDLFTKNISSKVHFHKSKGSGFFEIKKIRKLLSIIEEYDVIHAHLFPSFYIVAILSLFHPNKVFVFTEHNTKNNRRKSIYFLLEKFVYSRYRKIVCISQGVERALLKWLRNLPTVVINNFVDIESISKIEPVKKNEISVGDKILIIMVGSLTPQKDQETVIKALSLLCNDFELLLIGEGIKSDKLKKLCLDQGVQERVHFLGVRNDAISLMKMSDYGILSSNWEGFGIVALEYMAADIVAIGSDVDGLNEVIPIKENLFQVGDFEMLAKRIEELENDKLLKKDILKIQKEVIITYDISNSVRKHNNLYLTELKMEQIDVT